MKMKIGEETEREGEGMMLFGKNKGGVLDPFFFFFFWNKLELVEHEFYTDMDRILEEEIFFTKN